MREGHFRMKALSTIQPWATLQITGAKKFETRSWSTTYRGQLAIHASAKQAKWGVGCFEELWALRELVDAMQEKGIAPGYLTLATIPAFLMKPGVLPIGAVLGTVDLVAVHRITPEFKGRLTQRELAFGDYTIGRYAWELKNPVAFERPIPAKGAQGLWNWEVSP